MTASDESELHSAQPLLSNFDDISLPQKKLRDASTVSFRSLEDGSASSDSGSEFGDLRRQRRPGILRRLRMSMRRRTTARHAGYRSVKFGSNEEKRKSQNIRWRKRTCLALPVLAVCIL